MRVEIKRLLGNYASWGERKYKEMAVNKESDQTNANVRARRTTVNMHTSMVLQVVDRWLSCVARSEDTRWVAGDKSVTSHFKHRLLLTYSMEQSPS